jgi:TolB-like protein
VAAWGLFGFAALQVAEPLLHAAGLDDKALRGVVLLLAVGFPVVVAIAWAFDLGTGGLVRVPAAEEPHLRGGRLALVLGLVGLALASPGVAWFLWDRTVRPAATAAVEPTLAVLPFADVSERHDQEYFADGIADEILSALTTVEGLRVTGRQSSFSMKALPGADLPTIAAKLHATHLLTGSVRKSDDRLRISTELVEAASGVRIWANTFERRLSDVFAIQDEIAASVVQALRGRLARAGPAAGAGERTASSEAHDLVLVGRQLLRSQSGSDEALKRAAAAFDRATQLDPGYAAAWAGLAKALARMDTVDLERARAAAERAVALAPESVPARLARAAVRDAAWDLPGWREDVGRAEALAPGSIDVVLERTALGNWSERATACRKATVLDPLWPGPWRCLGHALRWTGDLAGARAAYERANALDPHISSEFALASIDLLEGHPERAREAFSRLRSPAYARFGVALADHALGDREAVDRAFEELEQLPDPEYFVGHLHAWRGEVAEAIAAYERGRVKHTLALTDTYTPPWWRPIRDAPQFVEWRRRLGFEVP